MNTVHQGTEVVVRLGNTLEAFDPVCALLTSRGITLLARSMYADRRGTILLLLTDAPALSQALLTAAGYVCKLEEILWAKLPEYRPGFAAELCRGLPLTRISIQRMYVSTLHHDGCFVVLKTSDNEAALRHFQTRQLSQAA